MSGRGKKKAALKLPRHSSAHNSEPSPIDKHGNYYTTYMILFRGIGYIMLFCGLLLLASIIFDPTVLEGAGIGIHIFYYVSLVGGFVFGLKFVGGKYTLTSDALIIQRCFIKRAYPLDQLREENGGAIARKRHSMIFMYKGKKIKVIMPIMQGRFDFAERVAKAVGLVPGSDYQTYRSEYKEQMAYQRSRINKKPTKSQIIRCVIVTAIAFFVMIGSIYIIEEHDTTIAQKVFSQYSDKYSRYFTLLASSIMTTLAFVATFSVFILSFPFLVEKDYRYKSTLWVAQLVCFVGITISGIALNYNTYVEAYNDYPYVKNDAPRYIVTEEYATNSQRVRTSISGNTQRVYNLKLYHEDGTELEIGITRNVYERLEKGKYQIEVSYLPNLQMALDWEIAPIEKEKRS